MAGTHAPPVTSMEKIVALARSFAAARATTEALAEDIKAMQLQGPGRPASCAA